MSEKDSASGNASEDSQQRDKSLSALRGVEKCKIFIIEDKTDPLFTRYHCDCPNCGEMIYGMEYWPDKHGIGLEPINFKDHQKHICSKKIEFDPQAINVRVLGEWPSL